MENMISIKLMLLSFELSVWLGQSHTTCNCAIYCSNMKVQSTLLRNHPWNRPTVVLYSTGGCLMEGITIFEWSPWEAPKVVC